MTSIAKAAVGYRRTQSRHWRAWLLGLALLLAVAIAFYMRAEYRWSVPYGAVDGVELIAHAGGGLPAGIYTNSQQAMDRAYEHGIRLIEVDLSWTSDDRLVLIHDWGRSRAEWFWSRWWMPPSLADRFASAPDHADFMSDTMRSGLSQMDLAALLEWLRAHPGARIVTDVKSDNMRALTLIAREAPDLMGSIIPQIYAPEELGPVHELGFRDVIFTIYRSQLSADEIVAFAAEAHLLATTIPLERTSELSPRLAKSGQLFVHTTNHPATAAALRDLGVDAIYTDFLVAAGSRAP